MVTRRTGRHPLHPTMPMTHLNISIPVVDIAFMLVLYISTAFALSMDPTSRYMKEMRRLLGETDIIPVSPLPDPPALETVENAAWVDRFGVQEENGWSQNNYIPSSQIIDIPMPNLLDESMIDSGVLDTPQPSSNDAYYDRLDHEYSDETIQPQDHGVGQYHYSQQFGFDDETNGILVNHQTYEPSYRPQRITDLFDVVNEQITALGQHIQKSSNSIRSVIDTQFSQPGSDWEYENQEGYIHVEKGDTQQPQIEYFAPEDSELEAVDETYEHDSYSKIHDQSQIIDGQLYDQITIPEHQYPFPERDNDDAEQVSYNAAEEEYMVQKQENERIQREQLEQEYIIRLRAEVMRAKETRQENEAFRIEATNERIHTQQPMSIIKSRAIHQLPDTNDPLELLGLDSHNPPQTINDIRRAFLRMAKKYHPDTIAADATPEERERASINFARINSAYQLLKEKQDRLGDDYFATMLGGPMYEPRNSHIQQSFSRGYGYDDYSSIFSGNSYSARYGPMHGGQPRPQNGNNRNYSYGATRSPFRRNRQDVGDNCHVSGKEFPPFFNN